MKLLVASLILVFGWTSLGSGRVAAAPLAPVYSAGDAIIYQGLPTLALNSLGFASTLSSGLTGSGHDTHSVMKFDLSSLGIVPGQVNTATLNLYVTSTEATGFGVSPSSGLPVNVSVVELSSTPPWAANTVTWSNSPSQGSVVAPVGAEDTTSINGINQWITLDVTLMVKDWLTNSADNNGLLLFQPGSPVISGPSKVVAVYDGSDAGIHRAFLEIDAAPVPEPSTICTALVGLMIGGGALAWRKRQSARAAALV